MPATSRSPRHSRRLVAILAVGAVAAPSLAAGPAHAAPVRDSGVANNLAQPAPASTPRDSGVANNLAEAVTASVPRDSGPANNDVVTSSLAGTAAPDASRAPVADPGPVPVSTVDSGFDWGAAGLGAGTAAAVAVAVALIGLARMPARSRSRTHLAG